MTGTLAIQGRQLKAADILQINSLMEEHPDWGRSRLSQELCMLWSWRTAAGIIKDMAARTMLLKLEKRGHIHLPPSRKKAQGSRVSRDIVNDLFDSENEAIQDLLRNLQPLSVTIVTPGANDKRLFDCLLDRYHYLGHRTTVGENIRYLVRDCAARPVACVLFGSAAWKCASRDSWIGWDKQRREANLQLLTNNTRFLILPWVTVPHLASHILGIVTRRIRDDWQMKYGHPVHALETFVDRDRFRGTCYQAANWIRLGSTTGRTRNDRMHDIHAPVKDVYLYPLTRHFKSELCSRLPCENLQ